MWGQVLKYQFASEGRQDIECRMEADQISRFARNGKPKKTLPMF
jgi:hypothetical protein